MRGLFVHTELVEINVRDGMNEESDDDIMVHMNDFHIAVGGLKIDWNYAAPLLWAVLYDRETGELANDKTGIADLVWSRNSIRVRSMGKAAVASNGRIHECLRF